MLELAVLGLLKEGSMHGYVLKKRLDEQLGHFWRISYGSLYPAMKRLSAEGAIEISSPEGEPSRRKNVYHITPKGETLFAEQLESDGSNIADRDQFMLRFAFSRYMQPDTRRRMLEGRRGYLQDRLSKMTVSLKRMRDRMDAYSRELMQHGMYETEHDIRWLNDLLAAEAAGFAPSASTDDSESWKSSASETTHEDMSPPGVEPIERKRSSSARAQTRRAAERA